MIILRLRNKIILYIFILLCLMILSYSIYSIVKWKLDSNNTNKQIEEVQETVKVEDVIDSENTEIIEPAEEIPKSNPYWDYIKMNMIDINFNELKNINNDVKGWIKVNGTNINYPFVQSNNNKYYLTHSFDKSYNSAGWLFLDYRNNINNNKNTIIYAHGRNDKTMFGSLRTALTKNWLSNTNNYVIKISTEKENSLWQIFSVYRIPTTSDYLQTKFESDREYQEFLNLFFFLFCLKVSYIHSWFFGHYQKHFLHQFFLTFFSPKICKVFLVLLGITFFAVMAKLPYFFICKIY